MRKNLRFFTTKPSKAIVDLVINKEIVNFIDDELTNMIESVLGFKGFIWAYVSNDEKEKIDYFSGKFLIEFKEPENLFTLDKVIKYFTNGLDGKWYKKDLNINLTKEDFILKNKEDIKDKTVIILPRIKLEDVICIKPIKEFKDVDMDLLIQRNMKSFKNINGRDWTINELRDK